MQRHEQLTIRTPEGITFALPLAGPLTRFLALGVDTIALMLVTSIVGSVLRALGALGGDVAAGATIIAYFVLSLAYWIALEWWTGGRTLGKWLLRLRVVDAQGLRLQFSQVVVRNLLRAVDALPAFYLVGGAACFLSPRAQRLGDIAASTVVVRTPRVQAPDLAQLAAPKFNSLRAHPHLVARLRQRVSVREAGIALQAVLRRDTLNPDARLDLFRELADHFRAVMPFPEEAAEGLTDEQYVRNVVDVLFVKRESTAP